MGGGRAEPEQIIDSRMGDNSMLEEVQNHAAEEEDDVCKRQQKPQQRNNILNRICCGSHLQNPDDACLGEEVPLESQVPPLLEGIDQERSRKRRKECLERLYELTDQVHMENRVALVCSKSKSNVMDALIRDIRKATSKKASRDNSEIEIRLTCLILNNLSIPYDNKLVMVHWEGFVEALLKVIAAGRPEAYLCILCLQNLSVEPDCKHPLLTFCPVGGGVPDPVENRHSLLRTLELVLNTYQRYTFQSVVKNTGRKSVEAEAVRYTLGLFRNLTTTEESNAPAALLRQTDIPQLCLQSFLDQSPNPLAKWTPYSVEDNALVILVNLAQWPESTRLLLELEAPDVLSKLLPATVAKKAGKKSENKGTKSSNIHAIRASVILCSLEANKSSMSPVRGISASPRRAPRPSAVV